MYEREQPWSEGALGFPVWACARDAVWPPPWPHGAGLRPAPRGGASTRAGQGCRSRPWRIPPTAHGMQRGGVPLRRGGLGWGLGQGWIQELRAELIIGRQRVQVAHHVVHDGADGLPALVGMLQTEHMPQFVQNDALEIAHTLPLALTQGGAPRAVVGIPAVRRVEEHGGLDHPEVIVACGILFARARRLWPGLLTLVGSGPAHDIQGGGLLHEERHRGVPGGQRAGGVLVPTGGAIQESAPGIAQLQADGNGWGGPHQRRARALVLDDDGASEHVVGEGMTGQRREGRADQAEAAGDGPCMIDGERRQCYSIHFCNLPLSGVATEARESSWRVTLALLCGVSDGAARVPGPWSPCMVVSSTPGGRRRVAHPGPPSFPRCGCMGM